MKAKPSSVFLDLITLGSGASSTEFVGPPAPERGGRTYGGQFLAQAVAAAYETVGDERRLHSLHSYFLRPGDVDQPTNWQVEVVRDGRSFALRAVVGRQSRGEVFRMTASFQTPEPGFDYGPPYPTEDVPRPGVIDVSYVDFCHTQKGFDPDGWFGQDRPMDIRYINPPNQPEGVAVVEPQLCWTRLTEAVPDDPAVCDAGLAYLADATLVDHVTLPHGHRWHDSRLTGASLDHAMWFHRPTRPDEWLLYDQRVETTSGARGLATGRFYAIDGTLVATCSQEGLMRWQ